MHNRLVKLLKEADENTANKMITDYEDAIKDNAEYLLANGVIVLPCKVGDMLYYIATCKTAEDFGKKYVSWERVKQISINAHGKWVYLMENSLINFDEIGKVIFLTKEEAEKALAKRKGGAE